MDMSIRFPGLKLVLDYVPKSFEIFGFEITIYGVLIAVGMILGIFFVVLEARRNHEDPDGYLDLTIITLIAGVIGARLLYAAFSWSLYKNDPGQILNVRSGGMLFYGRSPERRGLLPAPQKAILENGRSCLYGNPYRADNRKVGKFL